MPSHMWPASPYSSVRHVSPPRREATQQQVKSYTGHSVNSYSTGGGVMSNQVADRDKEDMLHMITTLQQEKDMLRKQALDMRVALQRSQGVITQMGKQQQQQQQHQQRPNDDLSQTNPWLASLVGQKGDQNTPSYSSLENELKKLESAPQSDWVARGRKAELQQQLNQQKISSSTTNTFMGSNTRNISTQTHDDEPVLFGKIPITLGSLYSFYPPSMTQPISVGHEQGADVCIDMKPSTVMSLQKQVSELTLRCTQLTCEVAAVRSNNPGSYINYDPSSRKLSSDSDRPPQNDIQLPIRKQSVASSVGQQSHKSSSSKSSKSSKSSRESSRRENPIPQQQVSVGKEVRGRSDSQTSTASKKVNLPIVREETPIPETQAPVPMKQEIPLPTQPEEPAEMVRIGLVGDNWPCPDGAARPATVCSIPKKKTFKSSYSILQESLGIDDLSGFSLYRNATGLPKFSPGEAIDENKTPAEVGFEVRGLIVVTKK